MGWQDKAISAITVGFLVPLVLLACDPSARVSTLSAYVTASLLLALAGIYLTMQLRLAPATTLISALLWIAIGLLRGY